MADREPPINFRPIPEVEQSIKSHMKNEKNFKSMFGCLNGLINISLLMMLRGMPYDQAKEEYAKHSRTLEDK